MTSLVPLERSKSGGEVLKNQVTMGVWKSLYRTPTPPPPPVVAVEFRSTAAYNQPRKSYHMGWAQVVEELSWKFNNPNNSTLSALDNDDQVALQYDSHSYLRQDTSMIAEADKRKPRRLYSC
ncbi:unnamed protein product [Arctia plantaginis]|uniref:Uncharacterized protein n=1 Tax=Arctia plantaginis TaxID=874455 RepID=A0A8S1A4H1_ARCPL|nr:unnamed protein product [Arctia plantaginis]